VCGWRWLCLVSILGALSVGGLGAQQSFSEEGSAKEVGSAVCRACHTVEADHWATTIHARLFEGRPRNELQARSCEACHGPGSEHVADPASGLGIVAFTRDSTTPVAQQNAMCLTCHAGGERLYWPGSPHEGHGLACSDCHNPMAETSARGLLRARSVNLTCFGCHPEKSVEFRKRSHMPLHEGKINCADCHNPHGSYTDPLLRGDSVPQLCHQCHPDKRGPFLWEHPPARENCLECHTPHGSNHESLLVSPPPFLCQRCHGQITFNHPAALISRGNLADGSFPDPRALGGSCTNCHIQIHGSNHPSGVRFHR